MSRYGRTPITWDENAEPTPEQLADWLQAVTREELVSFAGRMIELGEKANRCFVENHPEALEALKNQVVSLENQIEEMVEKS